VEYAGEFSDSLALTHLTGELEIYHAFCEKNPKAIIELRTKELAEANRKLEALSNTDGLTNIGNRRLFDNSLNQAWEHCIQTEMPIALIMLDIDHFKQFNDLWPRCR
jgi:PleD family two-component response regulator